MSLSTVRDASFYPAFTNIAITALFTGSNASLFVLPALISALFLLNPFLLFRSWYIVYSIRSEDIFKLIEVRKNTLEIDCPPIYHPHLFVNSRGEYECSVIETNRIRQLLGLSPLEEYSSLLMKHKSINELLNKHIDSYSKRSKT